LTNFGKKSLPLQCRQFKAFFQFFCFDFLHIDPSNDFCFCKFFAKGLNSEGERLKVKFWSSEMVKFAGVSTTIVTVAVATTFRVMMKTTV
jgi:hypothetical protein